MTILGYASEHPNSILDGTLRTHRNITVGCNTNMKLRVPTLVTIENHSYTVHVQYKHHLYATRNNFLQENGLLISCWVPKLFKIMFIGWPFFQAVGRSKPFGQQVMTGVNIPNSKRPKISLVLAQDNKTEIPFKFISFKL